MVKYFLSTQSGRLLVAGTLLFIVAYFLPQPLQAYVTYLAMIFLGYESTHHAVIDTFEKRKPNVDLLMVLAAVGAALIHYEMEGAMLLFIFNLAENLEHYANQKSTKEIKALMNQVPQKAKKIQASGEILEVETESLQVGDRVLVSKGDQVPIDGYADQVVQVNEAALTGESVPVAKEAGAEVFAGTVNEGNAFNLEVSKAADQTIFSNIIRMVKTAQERPSRVSKRIDKIEPYYVTAVILLVPLFIFLLMQWQGLPFREAFYRGMVFLTVASPCALVASVTPATLSAISNGARHGILFKGGAALEALASMSVLLSDKTGTLTVGDFAVVDSQMADPAYLAQVITMEQESNHPIAKALVTYLDKMDIHPLSKSAKVEEVAGKGLKMGDLMIGKPANFTEFADPHNYRQAYQANHSVVLVTDKDQIVGYFALSDQIRPQAKAAVNDFKAAGVDVHLLTGDNLQVAQAVAHEVGIDHVEAGMMPEDKYNQVLDLQKTQAIVGMIGDGINDAPALAAADIGIGMGAGSAVALESSDVIIAKNNLQELLYAYQVSHHLNHIINQNMIFAVGVIILLISLNLFGVLPLPLAVACHEGSTILVILNGLRLLAGKPQGKK